MSADSSAVDPDAVTVSIAPSRPATCGDDLGPDEWSSVASFLPARSLAALSSVSRTLQAACDAKSLWRELLARDWNVVPTPPPAGAGKTPDATGAGLGASSSEALEPHGERNPRQWSRRFNESMRRAVPAVPGSRLRALMEQRRRAEAPAEGPPNPASKAARAEQEHSERLEALISNNPRMLYKLLAASRRRQAGEVTKAELYSAASKRGRCRAWCARAGLDVIQYAVLLGCWAACIPLWLGFMMQKIDPEGTMRDASWFVVFAPLFAAIGAPFVALALHACVVAVTRCVAVLTHTANDLRNPCYAVADGDDYAWPGAFLSQWRGVRADCSKGGQWLTAVVTLGFALLAPLVPLMPCLKLEGLLDISWGAALAPALTFLVVVPATTACGCCTQCLDPDQRNRFDPGMGSTSRRMFIGALLFGVCSLLLIVLAIIASKADGASIALKNAFVPLWLIDASAALTAVGALLRGTLFVCCVRRGDRCAATAVGTIAFLNFCIAFGPFVIAKAAAVAYDEQGGPFPAKLFFIPLIVIFSLIATAAFLGSLLLCCCCSKRAALVPRDLDPSSWPRALCSRTAVRGCWSTEAVVASADIATYEFAPRRDRRAAGGTFRNRDGPLPSLFYLVTPDELEAEQVRAAQALSRRTP